MHQALNLAIVGCGWAGQRHAFSCKAAGVRIGWVVDVDLNRAKKLRDDLGPAGVNTNVSNDYEGILRDAEIGAVSLCVPHDLHAPMALQAANAGKHILVEKPLAANLEEADEMIAAAEKANVILMVAENVRFSPIYRKIADDINTGLIGDPAFIQITRQAYLRESFIHDRPWFLDAKKAAGGIMMSGGIHDFETMRMLIGEVESVYSLRAPQRFIEMEGDDTSAALVRFRNGAVGMLFESFITKRLTTAAGPEVHTLRIDGSLGSIAWEGGRIIRLFTEGLAPAGNAHLVAHDTYIPEMDTFVEMIQHFTECIQSGKTPVTSGQSQRNALAAVMAAYRSMESGTPVMLDDI